MMPETRFTEFPALSVDPMVGISVCTGDRCLIIFLTYDIKKYYFFHFSHFTSHNDLLRTSFVVFGGGV